MPVETSAARRWAPAGRKASWRDELLSKRCVSAQWFCSAAIASKSIGSATAKAATVSEAFGREGEGVDKKSATMFFSSGRYNICTLNTEIKAKWRCWQGEIGTETWAKAVTSGLRSVQSWKIHPSQKWRKCRIAANAANNSRSKLE